MSPADKRSQSQGEVAFDVSFVADVHLIEVLGEQLIGSEKVGVLELVKNSYDAGATRCEVWVEKVPGLPEVPLSQPALDDLEGPILTIVDNGRGMDEATIRNGWLRPATTLKTSVKQRLKVERERAASLGRQEEYENLVSALRLQHGGRLPLGEKGVGRFASQRLGRYLELQTKTSSEPFEWFLKIDWADFSSASDGIRDLQSVPLKLIRRSPTRDYGPSDSGTILRIYGGRAGFEWTASTAYEIGQAIVHLRSPGRLRQPPAFVVEYHCPQISASRFESPTETVPAPFEVIAVVDEQGMAEIEIRFVPPESLQLPMAPAVWSDSLDLRTFPQKGDQKYWRLPGESTRLRQPQCGPFTLELKLWLRNREWIPLPDTKSFLEYLDEFGGIGIYRDGLSILPAQLASRDDWLHLSAWHIQKGTRISYYQMWGSIDLIQEKTLSLVDRTSREGMLQTRAFDDLRELTGAIILLVNFQVNATRDRYNVLKRGERISQSELNKRVRIASQVLRWLSRKDELLGDPHGLPQVVGASEHPAEILETLAAGLDEIRGELKDLRRQSDGLLEAAGYGIAIAVGVHEIEKATSRLYFGLERLTARAVALDHDSYTEAVGLSEVAQSLLNELKRLAPLRVTRLDRTSEFSVRDSVLAASGAFRLSWDDLGIAFVQPQKSADFKTRGSFAACSQVFANLFDNATYWLGSSAVSHRMLAVRIIPESNSAVVADSGPGIDPKMEPHLFELFYSLKNPPSGLGLYICRYYMQQMKGSIRESYHAERLPGFDGASFTLVFPMPQGSPNG
jgi:signal transduction histidine kinase